MPRAFEPQLHRIVLALILLLAFAVYAPGLGGGFAFDDIPNIVDNRQLQIIDLSLGQLAQATFSLNAGPLMRPISMASFALNHYFSGLDPYFFKLTNLVLHLLTGVVVYWLTTLVLGIHSARHAALDSARVRWISAAVAAAWLLHPMNLTTVLYVVQRMAGLAALFMYLGVALYLWGRLRQLNGRHGGTLVVLSFVLCVPLAIFSKENGALLPFILFVVEWALLGFHLPQQRTRLLLLTFLAVVAVLPALLIGGYLLLNVDWLHSMYEARDFTLQERLLTQSRVVWFYLLMSLLPVISRMGLYHDDIVISTGLTQPLSTVFAIAGLAGLLIMALMLRRRAPLLTLGVLFFLAGHSMESSVFSLEIAHEHRNYFPIYGVLLPAFYYLLRQWPRLQRARTLLAVALIGLLASATAVRAHYWGDRVLLAEVEAHNHPLSARSQYTLGRIYLQMMLLDPSRHVALYAPARARFEQSYRADGYNHAGLFGLLRLNALTGRPPEPQWVDTLEQRLREGPFGPFNAVSIRALSQCQVEGDCRLEPDVMNRIFTAALANPSLRGRPRALVYNEAMVHALLQSDAARALELGHAAIGTYPDEPQYWLNVISVLIHLRQLDEAARLLDALEQRELTPYYRPRVAAQRKALQDAHHAGQRLAR